MSGSSPWSIKGVSREDRELAKEQARKTGEPIGVWLARRIRDAAAEAPHGAEPVANTDRRTTPAGHAPPEGERRQGFGRRVADQPDFGFGPGNWRQARETILAREDARFSEGVAALRDRVRSIETRMVARSEASAEIEGRLADLGSRIADLAGRLEALETRSPAQDGLTQKVGQLEEDLSDLDRFARRLPGQTADEVEGVQRQVEQLVDRMRVVESFVLPAEKKGGFFSRLFGRRRR